MNPHELKSKLTNGTSLTGEEAKYLIDLVKRYEEEVRKAVEAERKRVFNLVNKEFDVEIKEGGEQTMFNSFLLFRRRLLQSITSNQDRV